ncbi:24960_t:CDS:2, partial [Dentiscutata erythropus]
KRQQQYVNKHRCELTFEEGDKVLVNVININDPIYPVFHVSMLKPYKENLTDFNRDLSPPPEIIPETNEEEYEVETILDKKLMHRKLFYLVK